MRVAHIIKATRIGGAERHLLLLLPALRRQNIDAHLIMLVEPNEPMDHMVDEAEMAEIPVQRLTIRRDLDPGVVLRLRRTLRDIQPDIVHTHLIHADIHGLIAAKLAGVRTVVTSRHNDDAFRQHFAIRTLNRLLWRFVSGGIAISQSIQHFLQDVEGAPTQKIHVVEYGIEHAPLSVEAITTARRQLRESLGLPDDSYLLGMACRLTEQKGIIYAIRAFGRIGKEYPQAHLIIAGDGELRAQLEVEAASTGCQDRIHFLGWRSDVPMIMAGLDVFVLSSLWEGFGLVLLEAMSRRLPIIASNVSAVPEIVVHGENGLLVPPRDEEALADAMCTLIEDKALARHLGLVGEDRLETLFSNARTAMDTILVYRKFTEA